MQQLAQRLPRKSWRAKKELRLWRKEHRRGIRYALITLGVIVAVLELIQLFYPSGRMLPFTTIGGERIGGDIATATSTLNTKYANASVVVKTDTKTFKTSFKEAGITIDARATATEAAAYPLWQRLLPLSLLVSGAVRDTSMQARYDNTALDGFAAKVQQEGHTDAVNATLSAEGGKVKVVPSTPTKDYPASSVAAAVKAVHLSPETPVTVKPKTTPAALTDEEAAAMVDTVQGMVDDAIVFNLEGKDITPSKKERGSWLTFVPDAAAKRLEVGLNNEVVKKYIESVQGESYKAPGTTRVQQIDDREVSRTVGASGRGVDTVKAIEAIDKAIKRSGEDNVTLAITDLAPIVAYDKTYSNSDQALASLVAQTAADKGGYGISLMEIDGRSANANGNKRFIAASTYKLYVAYAVVREVEAGRMSWSESMGTRTVAQCFDAMIIVSDNSCPVAFGSRIGWRTITNMMHELGLSQSTQLGSPMYTTANDLAYFLYRVEKGSLLSSAGRDRLISAMKRQSYTRAGIPRGAGGTVADKVGEVDGYYHDAAIVYGSKKTYILVIMTYGGSWSGIADATTRIHTSVNK